MRQAAEGCWPPLPPENAAGYGEFGGSRPQRINGHIRMVAGEHADVVGVSRRNDAAAKPYCRGDDEGIDCVAGVQPIAMAERSGDSRGCPPDGDHSDAVVQHSVDADVRPRAPVGLGQDGGGYSDGHISASRPRKEITTVSSGVWIRLTIGEYLDGPSVEDEDRHRVADRALFA